MKIKKEIQIPAHMPRQTTKKLEREEGELRWEVAARLGSSAEK